MRTKVPEAFIVRHSSVVRPERSGIKPMTKPIQRSYLLRLWHEHAGALTRATLIAVEWPDKPRHFANLDELFAFLLAPADPLAPADDRSQWDGDHCTPDGPC